MPRRKQPTRQAPLDRDTLIGLAGDLVDDHGLNALTLKKLAGAAGVTQPALYRHVDNLDEVWRLVGLAARRDLADAMSEATIGLSGADAVRAVATAWRDFGRRHPGRYRATERSRVSGDAELETAVARVVNVLALALRSYELDDAERMHHALLLRSALHGFVSFELGDGHPLTPPIDETFDRLTELLCAGLETAVSATAEVA